MVEHHIQNDLDAVLLQDPDQPLQLGALPVVLHLGGVAGVGSKKAHRVVSPVVDQLPAVHHPLVGHLVKFEDGHQLHRIDPQGLQIGQLLQQALKGARMGHPGGGMPGEAPHMDLVDDQVLERKAGGVKIPPVKALPHHPGVVGLPLRQAAAPYALSGHRPGVWVQQKAAGIKAQAAGRVIRPVHPIGVLKLFNIQAKDNHGKGVADAKAVGKGEHGKGLLLPSAEQAQLAAVGVEGVDCKADAPRHHRGPIDPKQARPNRKAANLPGGREWMNHSPVHLQAPFRSCGPIQQQQMRQSQRSPSAIFSSSMRSTDWSIRSSVISPRSTAARTAGTWV